eukprot:5279930-Amphidinium_carterae.1
MEAQNSGAMAWHRASWDLTLSASSAFSASMKTEEAHTLPTTNLIPHRGINARMECVIQFLLHFWRPTMTKVILFVGTCFDSCKNPLGSQTLGSTDIDSFQKQKTLD